MRLKMKPAWGEIRGYLPPRGSSDGEALAAGNAGIISTSEDDKQSKRTSVLVVLFSLTSTRGAYMKERLGVVWEKIIVALQMPF